MSHVSTLTLHQFRLGELAPDAAATVSAHVATCATCAGRLGHQRELRAAFQREPTPVAILPAPTWIDRARTWWWAGALVPVLAATVLVVQAQTDAAADEVHAKGGRPLLEAWVQTGETARPLYTGERVRQGTRVQLKFDPGHFRFVTLAGRDGTGAVEVYGTLPAAGPGLATAPFALTLDGTAGDQAFFAVLTDARPDPTQLSRTLRADPVAVREGEVASLVLQKE